MVHGLSTPAKDFSDFNGNLVVYRSEAVEKEIAIIVLEIGVLWRFPTANAIGKCGEMKIFREGPHSGSKLPVIEKDYTSCISDSFLCRRNIPAMPPEYPRYASACIVNKGKDIGFLSF